MKSRRKKFTTMYGGKKLPKSIAAREGSGSQIGKGVKKKKAPLGSGERFAALKKTLAGRKGVTNPGGLAAYIGRKKFGAKKMARMSAKGRKKS